MSLTGEQINDRVQFLEELMQCNGTMYLSRYDTMGTLLYSNSGISVFDTMLRRYHFLERALSHVEQGNRPLMITGDLGVTWAIVFQPDEEGTPEFLHVLGPILTTVLSDETLRQLLRTPAVRDSWKPKLLQYMKKVPVVMANDFFTDVLKLHYAVNNERIVPSAIQSADISDASLTPPPSGINYAEYWARETSMFEVIRTGDIHYKSKKVATAASILQDFYPSSDQALDEVRQFAAMFIGNCIRSAVDGGINADTAYLKGTPYLRDLRKARSFGEILKLCHNAFDDFTFQVHNHREQPNYSDVITSCVDYIESHTEDPIDIACLARQIGYSKYYLSRRFKEETGMSINACIKKARIERASYLLVTTKLDIQEISDRLHFGNRNFFTKVFKEETGKNPAEFRSAHIRRL